MLILYTLQLYQVYYYQESDIIYIKSDDLNEQNQKVNVVIYDAWNYNSYRGNKSIQLNEFIYFNTVNLSAFVVAIQDQKFVFNKDKARMNIHYTEELYNGQSIFSFKINFTKRSENISYAIYKKNQLVYSEIINIDYQLSYQFQLPKIFDRIVITQAVHLHQETPHFNYSNTIIIDEQIIQFQEKVKLDKLRRQILLNGDEINNFQAYKIKKQSYITSKLDGYCTISDSRFTGFLLNGGAKSSLCNLGNIPNFTIYAHRSFINSQVTENETLTDFLNGQNNKLVTAEDLTEISYKELNNIDFNKIMYANGRFFTLNQLARNGFIGEFNNFQFNFSQMLVGSAIPEPYLQLKVNEESKINYLYLLLQSNKFLNVTNPLELQCEGCMKIEGKACSTVIFNQNGIYCDRELLEQAKVNISIFDINFTIFSNIKKYSMELITPKILHITSQKTLLSVNYIILLVVETVVFIIINVVGGILYVKGKKRVLNLVVKSKKLKPSNALKVKTEFDEFQPQKSMYKGYRSLNQQQDCHISYTDEQPRLSNQMILSQYSTVCNSYRMLSENYDDNIQIANESILNMYGVEQHTEPPVTSISVNINDISLNCTSSLQYSQFICNRDQQNNSENNYLAGKATSQTSV